MQRNELEDFFLECVEEVRKDIARRRAVSANLSNKKMKRSSSTRNVID